MHHRKLYWPSLNHIRFRCPHVSNYNHFPNKRTVCNNFKWLSSSEWALSISKSQSKWRCTGTSNQPRNTIFSSLKFNNYRPASISSSSKMDPSVPSGLCLYFQHVWISRLPFFLPRLSDASMEGHILTLDPAAQPNAFQHNQRYTSHGYEGAVLHVHGHAVNDQCQFHQFRLLVLFTLLLFHLSLTRINEAKVMDIL
jgi:hypothetical protein